MNWLRETLLSHSAIQAVVVICLICAVGLSLGKMRLRGISLGVAYVFFTGILAGALGLDIDHDMLVYAESFGLILFVYMVGLQVGPGFVSTFRHGGMRLGGISLALVALGTIMALIPVAAGLMPVGEAMGVLCGATTNTPALGAAQQTLEEVGQSTRGAALACAVTYPIGLVGVIAALIVLKRFAPHSKGEPEVENDEEQAFIASFHVENPAIFGKRIGELADYGTGEFVVSRVWHDGKAVLADDDTRLESADRVLVITRQAELDRLTVLFGQRDEEDWNNEKVDWNALDSHFVSQRILITRTEINGRRIGELHLHDRFGVNVSRVKRAGLQLVATPSLVLRMGDRLTVVGRQEGIDRVTTLLGNAVRRLEDPNMVTIFLGLVLGLALGCVPLVLPGTSFPARLGLAGGPIIAGILIGAYGPRLHMVAYTTTSANLMLRSLGLSMYLACLGLDAGPGFVEMVCRPEALVWIAAATLVTFVPVLLTGLYCMKAAHRGFATAAGMLCGAMANPVALNYVNDTDENDKASVSYAAVYPLCMFVRVLVAQILVMIWFS